MSETKRLGRTVADIQQPLLQMPAIMPGYVDNVELNNKVFNYRQVVKDSRYYYRVDPVAGTVVNRICDISITPLRNRRKGKNNKKPISDEIMAYYNFVATGLNQFLKEMALEYILHGMAIPEFSTVRKMGTRATEYLGRTRYEFPDKLWCRNIDNIELKRLPSGGERLVFLKIPTEDILLIKAKGKSDPDRYDFLLKNFADYVAAIEAGKTKFQIDSSVPIYRRLTSFHDYPIPYLSNAIDPIKHKARLKAMDMSITNRVIEAVRQVKIGNDTYPADDEDIKLEEQSFALYQSTGERVFNYFTNHTVEVTWSYPPFEALLAENKYAEANLDIFFALGFPRIWVNGETEKSNSSDNALAAIGPLSTIDDVREALLSWVKIFYEKLADLNRFDRVPEPYFSRIDMADIANLIQYAKDYHDAGALSKDTLSSLFNTDYETEYEQRLVEQELEKELEPEEEVNPLDPNQEQDPEQEDNAKQKIVAPKEKPTSKPTNKKVK